MNMAYGIAREWPSDPNNRQDPVFSERREEVLRRLRLRLTYHENPYANQKIQNTDMFFAK